jgi:preprotein translocase subunit YajC
VVSGLWIGGLLGAAPDAGNGFNLPSMLLLWLPILAVFWFLMIRPQQKEQAKRRQMLGALKKNDHVITAGGIYGVVTNVHREADEVTIKVDEATNTKLRVTLGSITRVVSDDTPSESSAPPS